MKIYSVNYSKYGALFLCFCLFLLSFQFNFFNAITDEAFSSKLKSSESLVIGRIIENNYNGVNTHGGFMGYFTPEIRPDLVGSRINHQYDLFENGLAPDTAFRVYNQSFGLQGYFYTFLDFFFEAFGVNSGEKRLFLLELTNSIILSLFLCFFIYFAAVKFGITSGVITTIFILYSEWLVVFANNLYWMFFLILAPFILVTMLLYFKSIYCNRKLFGNFYFLYATCFIAIFTKSLAGYEYISTIMVSCVSPIILFAIAEKWGIIKFIRVFVIAGFSALLGFISAILLHLLKLAYYFDSLSMGIARIYDTILKRTHGDPLSVAQVYRDSLESSIQDVLIIYWNGPIINLNSAIGFGGIIAFSEVFFILLVCTILSIIAIIYNNDIFNRSNHHLALIVTMWFSFMAPVSWHVLAKGHSYIHTFMNHVLWYVPFLLIAPVYIGYFLNIALKESKKIRVFSSISILLGGGLMYFGVAYNEDSKIAEIRNLKSLSAVHGNSNLEYFIDENRIIYLAEDCDLNYNSRFFLHVFPRNISNLSESRRNHKYDNLDFDWDENQFFRSGSSIFSRSTCLATVRLGSYPIKSIQTGQFAQKKRIWTTSIDFDNLHFVDSYSAANFNDKNWLNGISRHQVGFFVPNNIANRQSLKVGDKLLFSESGNREVTVINYNKKYMNVYVSGERLDPRLDGHPNNIKVVR